MPKQCKFSFSIQNWNIVCNKIISVENWQKGYAFLCAESKNLEDFSPKLTFLPPLQRRRLSPSARLFCESAWNLVGDNPNIPVVYASTNSEINRNFALWHSLLQEESISPTSFSLSVHNTLIGQWSELRQVKTEATSIMACVDNLECALLEGFLLLQEGHERVLIVIAENPIEEKYNVQGAILQPFAYALALVITQGEQFKLCLSSEVVKFNPNQNDNALTWVSHQYNHTSNWKTPSSSNGSWVWQKN